MTAVDFISIKRINTKAYKHEIKHGDMMKRKRTTDTSELSLIHLERLGSQVFNDLEAALCGPAHAQTSHKPHLLSKDDLSASDGPIVV